VYYNIYNIQSDLVEKKKEYKNANREFRELFEQCDYRFLDGYKFALENLFCNIGATYKTHSSDILLYINKALLSNSPKDVKKILRCADPITKNIFKIKAKTVLQQVDIKLLKKLEILNIVLKDFHSNVESAYKSEYQIDAFSKTKLFYPYRFADSSDAIHYIFNEFEKITSQYGYIPGIRELGSDGVETMHSLLHLLTIVIDCNGFYEEMIQSVKRGNLSPFRVAPLIDMDILFKRACIIGGMIYVPYTKYGTIRYFGYNSYKDMLRTDSLRKEIGLPPVESNISRQRSKYVRLFVTNKKTTIEKLFGDNVKKDRQEEKDSFFRFLKEKK
jgi:hypothetical protein